MRCRVALDRLGCTSRISDGTALACGRVTLLFPVTLPKIFVNAAENAVRLGITRSFISKLFKELNCLIAFSDPIEDQPELAACVKVGFINLEQLAQDSSGSRITLKGDERLGGRIEQLFPV